MWETTHSGVQLCSDRAKANVKMKIFFDVCCLLPPANEVWDKVMFLYPSVILFTGGRCLPHCIPGYIPPWADPPPGRHPPPPDTMGYGQQASGTHPTGMHSCFLSFLLVL